MKRLYYILMVLMAFSISACTENFEEFNTDEKNPPEAEGEYLFSQGQKELLDQISNTNVNLNIFKLIAQYWTETTYTDEANYDLINRTIPDLIFRQYYRTTLNPLKEAKRLISEDELDATETEAQRTNKLEIINLLEVYAYHNLVNIFGNVPYAEALNIDNVLPVYDDARTIYTDLLARVNASIAALDPQAASYGDADAVYQGDVEQWLKFANSLKIKIAICLADVDESAAQGAVESAVAGAFESNSDDALFDYLGAVPNANALYEDLVESGRNDFVPANTIVDLMASLEDPRMNSFFQNRIAVSFPKVDNTRQNDTLATDVAVLMYYNDGTKELLEPDEIYTPKDTIVGIIIPQADTILEPEYYLGGGYGFSNPFDGRSHIGDVILEPTFPGILITYSEIQFYLAEAAQRGWDVGTTAEDAYNEGVTSSILWWNGTEAEATDYLTANPYDAANWKESIGTQSYFALYTRGLEAWTQYRRLDYPVMNVAPSAETGGPVPTRFTYPVNEQTLNADNYAAAADAVGGDDMLTQLFWDIYPANE